MDAPRHRADPASEWLPDGLSPRSADESRKQGNGAAPVAATTAWQPPGLPKPLRTQQAHDMQRSRIGELEEALERREAEFEQREAEFEQREAELEQREAELEETLTEREAEFANGVRELEQTYKEKRAELEEQLADHANREAELVEQGARREEDLKRRIEELESAVAAAKQGATNGSDAHTRKPAPARKRASKRKSAGLDINGATFEELRDLGLSVNQSARVIGYRDIGGGFDSLDELDGISGLPKEIRATMKSQLSC
jgi:DNA uptake protein ComE-like DNA-binding protein